MDDWGDDRAIGSVATVGWSNTYTNTSELRTEHEDGSITNDWIISVRDDIKFSQLFSFPLSSDTRVTLSRRGVIGGLWEDVHRWDPRPRQVYYGQVGITDTLAPPALFVMAMLAVYEDNSRGAADPGRRVRVTTIGFELPFITHQLSMMDLQGGFVFLVEESTGILLAASDPSLKVLFGPNHTETIRPIESAHPLVHGAAVHLKSTDSWPTLRDELVQGEIDGVNHFFQCFLFHRHNLSWVGVYVIPAHVILGDVTSRILLGSAFNVLCSVILVVIIFLGVCHHFRRLRRDFGERARAVRLKVEEMNLAVGIAEQLANYDLRAAEEVLKGQVVASGELRKPLQQLLDNLTSYSPFLPDSLFTHVQTTEAGLGSPGKRGNHSRCLLTL